MTERLLLFLATFVALLAIVPLRGTAARGTVPFYAATGNAESARVTYSVPGAPLTEVPVDGGGTRSQATSGGIDGSRAYAAAPDPGEAVVTLPPLLRGLTGVSVPDYPLAATSQDPVRPEQTTDRPGIHLHAASSFQRSDAETVTGSADGQVQTTASAGVVNDEVVAHAEVSIRDVNAGPFRISGLRSAATLTRHADGTIRRDSELTVASASISGIPISIRADGITVANTATPIPSAESPRDLLIKSGIDVRVLAEESTDTRVMSPALVITTPFASPTDKPGTATYVLGRAMALLDVVTAPPPLTARPGMRAPVAGPMVAPVGPMVSPSLDNNANSAPTPRVSIGIATSTSARTPIEWQLRDIYLAFVIAALVLTAGNAALRHLGVRS